MAEYNTNKRTITTAVLLGLVSLTSLSALILSSSSSHASTCETINGTLTCTESTTASVTVPDVCTLEDSVVGTAHTAQVSVGSYTPIIGETTIKVTCNDNNGYSLYAVGYSNNTVGNTNLIGTNGNIATGTANDGSVSNWAMKLTAVSGSFTPTILNGYNNYQEVPDTATKVATRTESIDVSATSEIKTTYAVSISPSQTKGDYTGKVKYTVVHPHFINADGAIESYPITLSFGANTTSITIDGVSYTSSDPTPSLTYGTHTISAAFSEGYKFNAWTSTDNVTISSPTTNSTTITVTGTGTISISAKVDCAETITGYMQDINSLNAYCDNASGLLTDRRDNKNYHVAKLADGNIWMLDNLALDIVTLTKDQLYGTGANVGKMTNATNNALNYLKNGYGFGPYATAAVADVSTGFNNYIAPLINTGSMNIVPSDASSGNGDNKIGIYYNYCAASAGSYCYKSGSGSGNATEDICPYGWRLPTGTRSGEYEALYYAYDSDINSFRNALSVPISGFFANNEAREQGVGGSTRLWTSTYSNGNTMCIAIATSSITNPTQSERSLGHSIRCLLNS